MKTMSAGDANRQFSTMLREVAKGEVITVLSRGKAVATIAPATGSDSRRLARKALLERLRQQSPQADVVWTRSELYPD